MVGIKKKKDLKRKKPNTFRMRTVDSISVRDSELKRHPRSRWKVKSSMPATYRVRKNDCQEGSWCGEYIGVAYKH